MCEIKCSVILNEQEVTALELLLGELSESDYKKFGVTGWKQAVLTDLWKELPILKDDE